VAVAAALLVIVARSFGTYHWIALGGWAAIGLALCLTGRARTGAGGTTN
jgi:hypothetical protein